MINLKKTRSYNSSVLIVLIFIVLGYIFFFNSRNLLPNGYEVFSTPLNNPQNITDLRTVTINRWDYSPKQHIAEAELEFTNKEYDGNDTYVFTCLIQDEKGRITKTTANSVLKEPKFTVVQINNIPENYTMISLRVQPSATEDIVKLYGSNKSMRAVKDLSVKSKEWYQKNRINGQINLYSAKIDNLEKDNSAIKKKIENIQNKNHELDLDKAYQTADDIEKTNTMISDNNSLIQSINDKLADNQKQIKEYKLKIEKAQEKANAIK